MRVRRALLAPVASPVAPEVPPPAPSRRRRSRALSGPGQGVLLEAASASSPGVSLEEFVAGAGRGKRGGGGPGRAYDKAAEEIAEWRKPDAAMLEQERARLLGRKPGSWATATPAHFVALYAWLHEEVYGAPPSELRSEAWWGAVSAATKMLRDEFDGEPLRMLDFLRWVWRREREREKRAAAREGEGQEARRVGWRLQFMLRHLVTDYRVDIARAGKRVK